MGEKKKNKGLVWLIVILIVLVLGLVGYIVYDKLTLSNKENKKNTTTVENSELNTNSSDENPNYAKKDILLDFETVKENGYMEIGNELLNKYTDGKFTINLLIDNIKVNGKRHSVKIENFEPNDYDCIKGKDKVVYFDNETVYEPTAESCYLSSLAKIILFKNNYIVLMFFSQGGGWFNIYDSDGNEIKSKEFISVAEFKSVDAETIKFISLGYDENIDESMCRPNEYEITIENNEIKYTLVKIGDPVDCL